MSRLSISVRHELLQVVARPPQLRQPSADILQTAIASPGRLAGNIPLVNLQNSSDLPLAQPIAEAHPQEKQFALAEFAQPLPGRQAKLLMPPAVTLLGG